MYQAMKFDLEPFKFSDEYEDALFDPGMELFDQEWETELGRRGRRPVRGPRRRLARRRPRLRRRPVGRRYPRGRWPRPPHRRPRRRRHGRWPPPVMVRDWPDLGPEAPPLPANERIRWAQSSLNMILGTNLPVDGIMGPETRSALRSFQKRAGIVVDGILGPETVRALVAERRRLASQGQPPGTPRGELGTEVWEGEVNRRSRAYVRWVQRALNRILGLRLAVDGIMGRNTRRAVRRFQQRAGLAVDGIVGSRTERALIAAGAPPPPRAGGAVAPSRPRIPSIPSAPAPSPASAGRTLDALRALSARSTAPTVGNALSIMKAVCAFQDIPWRVGYVILEHEGGVRLFKHHDGVMQTISSVRRNVFRQVPRPLKLAALGLPANDRTPNSSLDRRLQAEFKRRLAVQIVAGVQELANNLNEFSGYVALAYQAYNAGSGWAYYTVTQGRSKRRPRRVSTVLWENMCRFGASLLQQAPQGLRIDVATWQCDKNMPGWFPHVPVFDRQSGTQLIAFSYLRSFTFRIRAGKPSTSSCNEATHKQRVPGSGNITTRTKRSGALDKLYDPSKLSPPYYRAAQAELPPLTDDGLPLKVQGGQLVKMPLMSTAREF